MDWKTFFQRLWMVGSALWLLGWVTLTDIGGCLIGSKLPSWCDFQLPRKDWGPIAAFLLGVPLGVWLLGAAMAWFLRQSSKAR